MISQFHVNCINKEKREDPYTAITHIGYTGQSGPPWRMPQDRAIEAIEGRDTHFYVLQSGRKVNLVVEKSPSGNKYLKTESDEVEENNLLTLAECPNI